MMTPYLFVFAFMVFITGVIGPVICNLLYNLFFKNSKNESLNNYFLHNLTELFTEGEQKKFLSRSCFSLGLLSVGTSACLMLFIGFENPQTRDLGLFVGLWASTLLGFANYFKN